MPRSDRKQIARTFTYEGKRYYAYGETELEAEIARAELKAQLKHEGNRLSSSMTVRAWAQEWLDTYINTSDITQKSARMYRQKLDNFILPAIGSKKLQDIREPHLQRIVNEANSSKSTAEKVRLTLRRMFHQAVRARLITFDPAEDLQLPKAPDGKKRSITELERREILKLVPQHRAGLAVMLLYGCGLRDGEAIALRWADVDLDRMELTVRAAAESGNSKNIKGPKTAAGNRVVPIPPELKPMLEAAKRPWSDYVLNQPVGKKRHTESSFNDLWNNFKRALDIRMGAEVYRNQIVRHCYEISGAVETNADWRNLTPYALRHTFATDLQRAGVEINVSRYLMGHESVETTSKFYIDTTPDVITGASVSLSDFRANVGKPVESVGFEK